jgi:hypothetical protein
MNGPVNQEPPCTAPALCTSALTGLTWYLIRRRVPRPTEPMISAQMDKPRKILRKIRPAMFRPEPNATSASATRACVRCDGPLTPAAPSRNPAAP